MKVLYLAPPRIKAERLTAYTFVDEEIIALADAGNQIYLLTYPLAGALTEPSPHPGVQVRELPSGKSLRIYLSTLRAIWKVRRYIPKQNWLRPRDLYHAVRVESFAAQIVCDESIDLVHSNFGWAHGYGGVLSKILTGKPLIATFRGMDVLMDSSLNYGLRSDGAYDRALGVLLSNADRTTHVSNFIRDRAIDLGAIADRAVTVQKGVDCERFCKPDKIDGKADGSVDGKATVPTIMTVAGLIKRKGIDYIIRALAQIRHTHDFNFVIVGAGSELNNLKALCEELEMTSRTTFMGYVERDSIPRLFANCDIFVLASIWEGSGNVLLEALASACPVVCTESGGPPEYIVDGVTGFVVPVKDPDSMAAKISLLLGDLALRRKFSDEAYKQANERFRYERMIGDIIDVYNNVLLEQPSAPSGAQASAIGHSQTS